MAIQKKSAPVYFPGHPYPDSIADAATILDAYVPKWHTKIDLHKLDMCTSDTCVLGQLFRDKVEDYYYNGYDAAMNIIFGIRRDISGSYGKYSSDKIFGVEADRSTWIEEINRRNTVVSTPVESSTKLLLRAVDALIAVGKINLAHSLLTEVIKQV